MLGMVTGISFVKDNTSTIELEFYEAYTLGNQNKMHSKKIFTH